MLKTLRKTALVNLTSTFVLIKQFSESSVHVQVVWFESQKSRKPRHVRLHGRQGSEVNHAPDY